MSCYLETNNPPQVKNHRLTLWWKTEAGRSKGIWVRTSRQVKSSNTFWHFWSIRDALKQEKQWFLIEYSNTNREFQIEIFVEEIKLVVMNKQAFEEKNSSRIIIVLLHSTTIMVETQAAESPIFKLIATANPKTPQNKRDIWSRPWSKKALSGYRENEQWNRKNASKQRNG